MGGRGVGATDCELRQVFGHGSSQDALAGELLTLRQGQQSIMDFTVDFQIVAMRSGWPLEPLADAFLHRLVDHIRDLLIAYMRQSMLNANLTI